jgi:hypothetical protein
VKSELARALPEALAAVLAAIGVAEAAAKREQAEMREHVVGKTASRTVLGSMNDFAVAVEYAIRGSRPVESLLELELFLAETPCSPLGYERPMGVARRLLEASSSTVDS